MVKYYIFKKCKDGFLYPQANGEHLFGSEQTLVENIDNVKDVISENYINYLNKKSFFNRPTSEDKTKFNENYIILFELGIKKDGNKL